MDSFWAMGVAAARLVFLAFLGLTGSIIYNALYLQDSHNTPARATARQEAASAPSNNVAKLPPVRTDLPSLEPDAGGEPRLLMRAVQRELAARGLYSGPVDGLSSDKTKAAISTYEKDHGLPVTGTATDDLLRHILLGESAPSGGTTGSVSAAAALATANQASDVKAVQQVLADLGYSPGPVDGAMGDATARAISAFQHDRKIDETGRITPELLGELERVTGRQTNSLAAQR